MLLKDLDVVSTQLERRRIAQHAHVDLRRAVQRGEFGCAQRFANTQNIGFRLPGLVVRAKPVEERLADREPRAARRVTVLRANPWIVPWNWLRPTSALRLTVGRYPDFACATVSSVARNLRDPR